MRSRAVRCAVSSLAALLFTASALRGASAEEWRIQGKLSEACSCSVPCTCNFGEGPSPGHFCWLIASLDIREGSWGAIDLAGLKLALAGGGKGIVFFLDEDANTAQKTALRAIGRELMTKAYRANGMEGKKDLPPDFRFRGFKTARIHQEVGDRESRVKIAGFGGFETKYILGIDGKTPVRVLNNWSWNITGGIKGKAKRLHYKDGFGNAFDFQGVNANEGDFDWSDKTAIYFR